MRRNSIEKIISLLLITVLFLTSFSLEIFASTVSDDFTGVLSSVDEILPEAGEEEAGIVVRADDGTEVDADEVIQPADAETMSFEIVTEVFDYGQRVRAVIIKLEKAVDGSSISAETFTVSAKNTNPSLEDAVFYEGGRKVLSAYISADKTVGNPAESGKFIVLELEVGIGRDMITGYPLTHGSETFTGSTMLDMDYKITQNLEYSYADEAVVAVDEISYVCDAQMNLVVDEFKKATVVDGENTLNYRYFDPSDAGYVAPADGYPLVLFLHGGGERGSDNNLQIIANKGATLWAEPGLASNNPAHVLAPQTSINWLDDTVVELVMQMIEDFKVGHNVDTDRIYVQGMSMGGMGTWNLILKYPGVFAAAMPICGRVADEYYEDNAEAFDALKYMPIWTFVADNDSSALVDGTKKAVATIKELNGSGIKFEPWTAGSCIPAHHSWETVYRIGTPYNWLFSQSLGRTNGLSTDPSLKFTKREINNEITVISDYELGQVYVIEQGDDVLIIDTAMGNGDLYKYITEEVIENDEADINILITHNHGDHTSGLKDFIGKDRLKKVYIHEKDYTQSVINKGIEAEKIEFVEFGSIISVGNENLIVAEISGHTLGSIVLFYKDYVLTGDAVGSGDLWLTSSTLTYYQRSLSEFVEFLDAYKLAFECETINVLPGHHEYKHPFKEDYIHDMLACVEGVIDGTITPTIYTRRETDYATYNLSNISYRKANVIGASEKTLKSLQDLMAKAAGLDKSLYTENEWKTLQGILADAKGLSIMLAKEEETAEIIKALSLAIEGEFFTVEFDVDGGTLVESLKARVGSKILKPANPTKTDFTFDGWYKEEALTTAWDFDKDIVDGDITLYAKWTKETTPEPTPTPKPSTSGGGASITPDTKPREATDTTVDVPSGTITQGTIQTTAAQKLAARFSDAAAVADWATGYVLRLVEAGVISGRANGTIDPNANVTRAEFMKMAVDALGLSSQGLPKAFSDVNDTHWFKKYVDIGVENGLARGMSDNMFGPNIAISRQDLCVMMYNAITKLGVEIPDLAIEPFTDSQEIADYAKDAVDILKSLDVIGGRSNGAFDPTAPITRAEASKIICEILDFIK